MVTTRINKPFTLVLCEKSHSATRIAQALSNNNVKIMFLNGVKILDVFLDKGQHYVVCSAVGHLYRLADVTRAFNIYPTFDLEWAPVYSIHRNLSQLKRLIKTISEISENATDFIHACDYDQEGEVIGYNILEYACKNKYGKSLRAKFSTLTDDEIRVSFENLLSPNMRLAEAGRSRHMIDFIYGVNLSRALSHSFKAWNKDRFRNLSIGRVQGPTLAFVVRKEIEIREHIPIPYWVLLAIFEKDGLRINAYYKRGKVVTLSEANTAFNDCTGKTGLIKEIKTNKVTLYPPPPFNLGDLQKEAYRLFTITPKNALSIAEGLYLNALISYPRTSSQRLPTTINYSKIISDLSQISSKYDDFARKLLSKNKSLSPRDGIGVDSAHPAIYPTGVNPNHKLNQMELKVYDLIVKRFFATLGSPSTSLNTTLSIEVNDNHIFNAQGKKLLDQGWMYFYQSYSKLGESLVPILKKGNILKNIMITILEKFTEAPTRFNPSTLLQRMEREKIGTKSTRADIIDILNTRNYITSDKNDMIEGTELGIVVIEALEKYATEIISTKFTKIMESHLEEIEAGKDNYASIMDYAVNSLIESLILFRKNEPEIGAKIANAARLLKNT